MMVGLNWGFGRQALAYLPSIRLTRQNASPLFSGEASGLLLLTQAKQMSGLPRHA